MKPIHKHMKGMRKTNNKNDPLLSKKEKYRFQKEIQPSASKINTKAKAKKPTKQAVLLRNKIQASVASNKTD